MLQYIIDVSLTQFIGIPYPDNKHLYTWDAVVGCATTEGNVYRVANGITVENVTTSVRAAQGKDY